MTPQVMRRNRLGAYRRYARYDVRGIIASGPFPYDRVCLEKVIEMSMVPRNTQAAASRMWMRAIAWLSCGDDSGQSLVEFGITLPVLLLVFTGICTFAVAMNNYQLLTDAASVGARQIAISRNQTLDPCAVGSAAVIQAAPTLKAGSLTFSYTFNGVAYSGTSCSSTSLSSGATSNLVQGMPASIHVTYPCSLVAYRYNFGTCNMHVQTTEVVQ